MQQQMELDMRSTEARGAARAAADADLLIGILRKRTDMQRRPAETLAQFMGWTDRRLRAAAEASGGAILSAPGCVGYRLAESTTVASYYEIERSRYRSQIRVMAQRLLAMDRAVHGGKRVAIEGTAN